MIVPPPKDGLFFFLFEGFHVLNLKFNCGLMIVPPPKDGFFFFLFESFHVLDFKFNRGLMIVLPPHKKVIFLLLLFKKRVSKRVFLKKT